MQEVWDHLSGAGAAAVFLQQSVWGVPAVPGFREHHRFRFESGNSRCGEIAGRGLHRAVDEATVSRDAERSEALGEVARDPDECAVEALERGAKAARARR